MKSDTPVDALSAAIDFVGSQSALAEKLSALSTTPVSQARVWNWLKRDMRAPAEVCPLIERITLGEVRCEKLRPDVDWGYLRATAMNGTNPSQSTVPASCTPSPR